MNTKYGDLYDWNYDELLPEAENPRDPFVFSYDVKLSSLDHYQGDLLPWCPIFGELPENNHDASCQITKCIRVIEEARELWGACPSEYSAELFDIIDCNSFPESKELHPFFPVEELLLARNLFLEWEEIRGLVEKERELPYSYHEFYHDGTTTRIPTYISPVLSETPEDALVYWFETLPSTRFENLKGWQVFSILAIYEARKVLNLPLYTHAPWHYYSKVKWSSIEEFEKDIEIIRQTQLASDLLQRAAELKSRQDIERGQKVLAAAKRSGEGRREQLRDERQPIWDEWQGRALSIWQNNPAISKNAVAGKIRQQLEREGNKEVPSVSTIRRRIYKLT